MINLPPLLSEYEPTRATLHAYALVLSTIARTHGIPHPKWWHVSLAVRPDGLVTDPIPLGDGGAVAIAMDLKRHEIVFRASDGDLRVIDMKELPTATEVGRLLIAACSAHGLENTYDRERFGSDEPRVYEPEAASAYFDTFTAVATVFERHRATLGDRVSPVQLWPHGFDLSFEWFGTRTIEHDREMLPAQLNLGFYPGGVEPYFYSNPWPFDDALATTALPDGARWHTEGWSGALMPYDTVRTEAEPGAALSGFAKAVFAAARPSLDTP
ncbi:MAG: DUF5996 family protein [Acidimicrobiia bacterium]